MTIIYKSDIPSGTTEETVSDFKRDDQGITLERRECRLGDMIVGVRSYDNWGRLVSEEPLKDGKLHGQKYEWYVDLEDKKQKPMLELIEPYENGLIHGTATQFGAKGEIMGTYTMDHGTGLDIWRHYTDEGEIKISEITALKDGLLQGYAWNFDEDLQIWSEGHWHEGKMHGIFRTWLDNVKLEFFIHNKEVNKSEYVEYAQANRDAPLYMKKDNQRERTLPSEIEKLLNG